MFDNIIQYVPFVGLMTASSSSKQMSPLATRLIEAAIIAGVSMYGTVKTLEAKWESMESRLTSDIAYIKEQIGEVKAEQRQVRRDLYGPRPQ